MKTVKDQIDTIQDFSLRLLIKYNEGYKLWKMNPALTMKTAIHALDWSCNHPAIEEEGIEPFEFYRDLSQMAENEHIKFELLRLDQVIEWAKTGIHFFEKEPKKESKPKKETSTMTVEDQIDRIKDYRIWKILKSNSRFEEKKKDSCPTLSRAILDLSWGYNHEYLRKKSVELGQFYGLIYNRAHGSSPQLITLSFDDVIKHLQGKQELQKKPYFPEDTPISKSTSKRLLL